MDKIYYYIENTFINEAIDKFCNDRQREDIYDYVSEQMSLWKDENDWFAEQEQEEEE